MTTVTESTKSQLLERVSGLTGLVRERADEAERERGVAADVMQQFISAGLARTLLPPRWGGYDLGLDAWYDVVRLVARVDLSHAWLCSLAVHHAHQVALFPGQAQEDVWGGGPDVFISSSVAPATAIEVVDGGFVLTGRAAFSSGVDHAAWTIIGGIVPGSTSAPDWRWFLVPRSDYTIVDTWDVVGMRGTGSKTVVTEGVFVPDHRVVARIDVIDGVAPGAIVNPEPRFSLPHASYGGLTFATPIVGAARGALDAFVDFVGKRTTPAGQTARDFRVRAGIARASADIDAADLLLRSSVVAASTAAKPTTADRATTLRNVTRAAEYAVAAIGSIMSLAGSSGYSETVSMQRAWRDINFASSHLALSPDINLDMFGRTALELGRSPRAAGI